MNHLKALHQECNLLIILLSGRRLLLLSGRAQAIDILEAV
jgi:hypothetical protein